MYLIYVVINGSWHGWNSGRSGQCTLVQYCTVHSQDLSHIPSTWNQSIFLSYLSSIWTFQLSTEGVLDIYRSLNSSQNFVCMYMYSVYSWVLVREKKILYIQDPANCSFWKISVSREGWDVTDYQGLCPVPSNKPPLVGNHYGDVYHF